MREHLLSRRGVFPVGAEFRPAATDRHKFLCLVPLFLLYPTALVLTQGAVLYLGLEAVAMGILAAFLFTTQSSRRVAVPVASIGAAALLTIVLATRSVRFAGSTHLLLARTALLLALLGTLTIVAFANVLKRERVTLDKVLGAICVYLLLGATWGMPYESLAVIQPASFRGPGPVAPAGMGPGAASRSLSFANSLYFSYVTLTTVGYGVIGPTTVHGRTLVWTEALAGLRTA